MTDLLDRATTIARQYNYNISEISTKFAQDTPSRVEQEARLRRIAPYLRGELASLDSDAPARKATTIKGITPCAQCGSMNTVVTNGILTCFNRYCGITRGASNRIETVSKPSLVCPKCKSNNFYIAPKNGDLHCFTCGKDSRGIGPRGVSRYTYFCTCGSGQVDVTRDYIRCRACGKKSMKGLH